MATKNVIIKRKIANEIFELLPKTSGAQVEVTYGSEVKDLATVLATVYTDLDAWNTFKKDVDFAGTDSALDTLRELIDYLSAEDVATSIVNQLADIKERLDAVEAKAEQNKTDIAALTQTVADNKAAADATEAKAEQNKTDIAALTQTVADNKAAAETAVATLTQTVADNKAAADATEAKAEQNKNDIAALQTTVASQARIIVAEAVPDDLTENDLMMQIV